MISAGGTTNFQEAKFSLTVSNPGADSVFFRIEHHFAMPDTGGMGLFPYTLTNRYWQVHGQFPADFAAQATVFYDGRGQGDQLDTELFAATGNDESLLFLLYRPGAGQPWQVYPDYTRVNIGTATDKFGQFKLSTVRAGEYTIGKLSTAIATREVQAETRALTAWPNPVSAQVRIESDIPLRHLQVIGNDGGVIREISINNSKEAVIDMSELAAGQYWIIGTGDEGIRSVAVQRL